MDFSEISINPIDQFELLKWLDQRYPENFLFEGFEEWEGGSPYSYIGVDLHESLIIEGGRFRVFENKGGALCLKNTFEGNPFDAFVSYLKTFQPESREGVPYTGGAVGFIGYDCVKYFERVLEDVGNKKGQNSEPDLAFMIFRKTVAVSQDRKRVIVIAADFPHDKGFDRQRNRQEAKDLAREIEMEHARFRPLEIPQKLLKINPDRLKFKSSLGEKKHASGVSQIKDHIKRGDIFQCVFSDQFKLPVKVNPLKIYQALRATNPSPFMFYFSMPTGVYLGASPERLVKVSQSIIETNPIAGTRPRGKNKADDKRQERNLLRSVKEKAEHLMLVDLGRNDIGRVSKPGTVKVVEFMKLSRFSDVMHLISKVHGRLDSKYSSWDALKSCFPAGTLSGAPKIKAMQIIDKLEKVTRGFYGGAVVRYDFSGDLDSCIAIRSLRVTGGVGTFQAGGGVVADSKAKGEYKEILGKSRSVRRALRVAEHL